MGPRKRSVEPGFGSRDHGSTSMPPLGSFRAETRASFTLFYSLLWYLKSIMIFCSEAPCVRR